MLLSDQLTRTLMQCVSEKLKMMDRCTVIIQWLFIRCAIFIHTHWHLHSWW